MIWPYLSSFRSLLDMLCVGTDGIWSAVAAQLDSTTDSATYSSRKHQNPLNVRILFSLYDYLGSNTQHTTRALSCQLPLPNQLSRNGGHKMLPQTESIRTHSWKRKDLNQLIRTLFSSLSSTTTSFVDTILSRTLHTVIPRYFCC